MVSSHVSLWLAALLPTSFHAYVKRLLIDTLSLGPLPQHVAMIMDGNRRYARQTGLKVSQGHEQGFTALSGLLEFFFHLNTPTVSVYAFAINNFERPPEEVDSLMRLAREKLLELASEGELLHHHDVRVKIVGARHLLPVEVRDACDEVERLTSKHTRATLNICMAYASSEEITHCVRNAASTSFQATPVTVESLEADLYTAPHSPPVDLLLRTSGVNRLSDYMTWQSTSNASIRFLQRTWPETGIADLLPVLIGWQMERIAAQWNPFPP